MKRKFKRRQFLQAAGLGLATTATGKSAIAQPAIVPSNPPIKWRLTASWPKSLDIAYGACETVAKMVAESTDNQMQMQVFASGEIERQRRQYDQLAGKFTRFSGF